MENQNNNSRENEAQKSKWLLYLLIPVAFLMGLAGHDASSTDSKENTQQELMYQPETNNRNGTGAEIDTITNDNTEY